MRGYDTPLYPGEIDYAQGRDGCWRAPKIIVRQSKFVSSADLIYVIRSIGGEVAIGLPRMFERRSEPRFEYLVISARDLSPPLVAAAIRHFNKTSPVEAEIAEWRARRKEPSWTF